MKCMIKAYETKLNGRYRLFPAKSRSKHIEGRVVAFKGAQPIFSYYEPRMNTDRIVDDVDIHENVQIIGDHD